MVAGVCGEVGAGWHTVDVDTDETLRAHWNDHVPVTFVDAKLHGRWFVDPDALRQALLNGTPRPVSADWRPPAPSLI